MSELEELRYAGRSRTVLNEPAYARPVSVFGIIMIMCKVSTPSLLSELMSCMKRFLIKSMEPIPGLRNWIIFAGLR